MPALAELLDQDQAAALARLHLELAIRPPSASEPSAARRPMGGQLRPVPAAAFRPAGEDLTGTAGYQEG
jgi:hypothetical protein